jgi:GGDEF domain-containing protein
MAASLAARLRSECSADVTTLRGGLGEFTVLVEGKEVAKASRLWYPRLEEVFEAVKAHLTG